MIRPDLSLSKNALNIGALVGLILSVIQLLAYTFSLGESDLFQWSIYIVLIVGISWGTRKYKELTGGYITYGQSLSFGMLLSIGASLIFAFFNYVYIKFMDPGFIETVLEQMEITLYESGYDDEKVEMLMELYNSFFGPGMFAFALLLNFVIVGLLASLIISFFVKNPKPFFEE